MGEMKYIQKNRQTVRSEARSVFCYWAVCELGVEGTHVAKRLKMSQLGVEYAIGKCFDHLGGRFAPLLFERLIEMDWLRPKEGKKTVFEVTEKGKKGFEEVFAIDISNIEK